MIIHVDRLPKPETAEELRARLRARIEAEALAAPLEGAPPLSGHALTDMRATEELIAVEDRTRVKQEQAASASGMVYRSASEPDADFDEFEVPAANEPESHVRVARGWA